MFSRLPRVARHICRPTSLFACRPAAVAVRIAMASADERNSRPIRTAACLIIGDEVLGGKVRIPAG